MNRYNQKKLGNMYDAEEFGINFFAKMEQLYNNHILNEEKILKQQKMERHRKKMEMEMELRQMDMQIAKTQREGDLAVTNYVKLIKKSKHQFMQFATNVREIREIHESM